MDEEVLTENAKKRIENIKQEIKENEEIVSKIGNRVSDWYKTQRQMQNRNRHLQDEVNRIEYGYGIMWCISQGMNNQLTSALEQISKFKEEWKEAQDGKKELLLFVRESEWKMTNAKGSLADLQMMLRNMDKLQKTKERPDRKKNYFHNKYY